MVCIYTFPSCPDEAALCSELALFVAEPALWAACVCHTQTPRSVSVSVRDCCRRVTWACVIRSSGLSRRATGYTLSSGCGEDSDSSRTLSLQTRQWTGWTGWTSETLETHWCDDKVTREYSHGDPPLTHTLYLKCSVGWRAMGKNLIIYNNIWGSMRYLYHAVRIWY